MSVQFTVNGDSLMSPYNGTQFYRGAQQPQSISVWINAAWDGNTGVKSYVGMYGSANVAGGAGSAIQFGTRTTLGQCNIWTWGGGLLVSTTGVVITANDWVNLTYTYDGTTHRIYYNGVFNNSSTTAQLAGNFDVVWLNGYRNGGTAETGTFQLDTYDYYNRALSADEVLTIYNTRGNCHGIVNGSILRYEFDENAVGTNIVSVVNQTDYPSTLSNLTPENVRSPKVTYSAGYVSKNLRSPQI